MPKYPDDIDTCTLNFFLLNQGTLTEGKALLVLTSLDQLLLLLQTLFTFFTKQATLKRRFTVLSLPLAVSVLCLNAT
jgi:hypothetical protein